MRRAAVASALASLLATAAVAASAEPDWAAMQVTPYASPKPAPGFSLPGLDGKTRSLGDFRGKVLMLFFWATW